MVIVPLLVLGAVSAAQCLTNLPRRPSSTDVQDRITLLRDIVRQKVDLKWLGTLQSSLQDRDHRVVLEGLRVWAKVGNDYDNELSLAIHVDEIDAKKLGLKGDLQAWHRQIINLLLNHAEGTDLVLRREALRTLCKFDLGAKSICPMVGICGTGADQTLWAKASEAINKLSPKYRAEFRTLVNDPDPDVVYNAVRYLGEPKWEAFGSRVPRLLSSPEKLSRAVGMWIANESPLPTRIALIEPFLEDADQDLRLSAQSFLWMTETEALRIATEVGFRSVAVRVQAIRNSGPEPNPLRDAVLRRLLADPEPRIRSAALQHMDERGVKNDPTIVRRGLVDPSPLVRAVAITLGAKCKLPGLLPFVKAGLGSRSREERQSALWSSMHIDGSEELTPEVVRAVELGVDDTWMGSPNFGDPRYAHLVEECLNSKSPDVRKLLCQYYSYRHKGPKPSEIMIRLARDPNPDVARLILEDLGLLADPLAYDVLAEQVSSNSVEIRMAASRGLGQTKRASALPVLQRLMSDASREVRQAAKWAIADLKQTIQIP